MTMATCAAYWDYDFDDFDLEESELRFDLDEVDNNYVLSFSTFTKMIDMAEYGQSQMKEHQRYSRIVDDSGWRGTTTFEEAIALARHGWPEGANRLKAKLDILQDLLPPQRVKPQILMSVVGPGTVDIGRYIAQHPEPWITYQEVEVEDSGEVIAVAFNVGVSADVSTERMFQRGAVACVLIDALEQLGKRVELTVVKGTSSIPYGPYGATNLVIKTIIKEANSPLDIGRLVFAVAHASYLRRLCFSLEEQLEKRLRNALGVTEDGNYGYSISVDMPNSINIAISKLQEGYTDIQLKQWIMQQLASLEKESAW